MRMIVLLFACIGVVLGMLAAWFWFLASRIEVEPVWGDHQPFDPVLSQAGWIAGLLDAASKSALLNRRAAAMTALAVLASTASSVAALFV